jgi:hypothetical protein
MTIDYSRVLRKLANQRGEQRGFAGLPVSLGEHSCAVGTDVFRDRPFASPGLVQAGEVELDGERFALLNSRIGTLQAKNLPLRTLLRTLRTRLFA